MGAKALAAVLLAFLAACGGAGERLVERLEVRLALRPDGSLEVNETWLVDVNPSTPSTFVRRLPRDHHDGLAVLESSSPGLVEQGKTPSVRWEIGAGWGAGLQSLGVRYVAANALALAPGRVSLAWPLLSSSHRWHIKQAYLHFESPPGVAPVTPGGIAESGWQVTEVSTGVQAIRANVGPGEPVTIAFEFSRDALKLQEPRWQFLAERAQEFKPAFMSAAGFVVVVGIAVLALLKVLVSAQAQASATRGLRVAGIVFLVLGALLAGVVTLTLSEFGPWAMGVPASIALVGVMFAIAGSRRARI